MITKHNLPSGDWHHYMKKLPTKMLRMSEPFSCRTKDGNDVHAEAGSYLAIDSEGYPYPVAASVHADTYIDLGPIQ